MSNQPQGNWPGAQQQPGQYPTQPAYGAQEYGQQPQYGTPPQQQYGQPAYGGGYPSAPPAPQSYPLAVVALILGILPTGLIGLIVGIIALIRAGKVGVGKAMSWIGIILSVLWMVGGIAITVAALSSDTVQTAIANANPRQDPGCVAAETNLPAKSDALQSGSTDPAAAATAIQGIIDELKADEAKTKVPAAKTAMENFRHDLESLQSGLATGNVDPNLVSKLTTDGAAIDAACS